MNPPPHKMKKNTYFKEPIVGSNIVFEARGLRFETCISSKQIPSLKLTAKTVTKNDGQFPIGISFFQGGGYSSYVSFRESTVIFCRKYPKC